MASSVVLNLIHISYPLIEQDYQIYPQYTQWCTFIENTKLIGINNKLLQFRMIYKNLHWLQFMVQ